MPITIIKKSAAPAVAVQAPAEATTPTTEAKPKPQGHCKPLPFDPADLRKPGRLRVGHLMALFDVSHSTFYKHVAAGLIPKPDGYDFKRPFWFTATIAPLFGVKEVQQ